MNYEYTQLKKLVDSLVERINETLGIPDVPERNPATFESKTREAIRGMELILYATVRKLDDVVTVLKKNNIDISGIFNL